MARAKKLPKMTNTALENKERQRKHQDEAAKIVSNEKIARENRVNQLVMQERALKQSERESRRQAVANVASTIAGNVVRAAGSVGGAAVGSANDPKWYTSVEESLRKFPVAIPSFYPLGSRYEGGTLSNVQSAQRFVSVHAMVFANAIGTQTSGISDSIANITASRLLTKLLKDNSVQSGQEAGDVMQYLLCSSSLHEFMRAWARAIAAAQTFSANNQQLAKMVVTACGFDFGDMLGSTNLAAHKSAYNQLVEEINRICLIPKPFYYYDRKWYLNSTVFKDSKQSSAQLVIPVAACYWQYDEANAKCLHVLTYTPGGLTLSDITSSVRAMIDAIAYGSNDLTRMRANFEHAYSGQFYQLEYLEPNVELRIVDIDEMLHQFMNASLPRVYFEKAINATMTKTARMNSAWMDIINVSSLDVLQDANGLLYQADSLSSPGISVKRGTVLIGGATLPLTTRYASRKLLNYYLDDISSDEFYTSTAFTVGWSAEINGSVSAQFCRTEVPLTMVHFRINYAGDAWTAQAHAGIIDTYNIYNTSYGLERISAVTMCDWHPTIELASFEANTGSTSAIYKNYIMIQQWDTVVEVSYDETIKNIHQTALYSLIYVRSEVRR